MSSGERPIGAAKGKQPNTEALCQPPPTPVHCKAPVLRAPLPPPLRPKMVVWFRPFLRRGGGGI